MQLLPLLGIGLFTVMSILVGCRLLARSGPADRVPALLIGAAFLAGGGIGQPMVFAGVALERGGSADGVVLQAVGFALLNIGAISLWCFTWRVFRSTEAWAGLLVLTVLAALVGSFALQASSDGFSVTHHTGTWFWVGFTARAFSPGWAAIESLRYYGLMRRRTRLGLAEPLVADRFLLWGISATAAWLLYGVSAIALAMGGADAATAAPAVLTGSCLGFVAAISMWLAFFPPEFYKHRFAAPDTNESGRRPEVGLLN